MSSSANRNVDGVDGSESESDSSGHRPSDQYPASASGDYIAEEDADSAMSVYRVSSLKDDAQTPSTTTKSRMRTQKLHPMNMKKRRCYYRMLLMFLKLHITNLKMRTHKLKIKQIQTKSGFWRVMFRYIPYTTSQQQDASEKIRFNETLQRTCEKWVVARGGKWNSVKYMALENLFIEANKTAYNKWVKPVKMSPIKHANSAPGSKVKFVLPRNITDVQIARKMEDIKNLQLERKQAFSDVPVINVPPPPPPPIPAAPQEDAGPSSFRPTPLDASQKTILDAFVLNLTELMMLGQIDADQVARIRSALPPSAASEPIPPTSLEPIVVDDIVTDEAWDSFHALLSMLEQQMVIGKNVKMHIDIEATRKIHQT